MGWNRNSVDEVMDVMMLTTVGGREVFSNVMSVSLFRLELCGIFIITYV